MSFRNSILTLTCLALLGLGYLADHALGTSQRSQPSPDTKNPKESTSSRRQKPTPTPAQEKAIEIRSIRNPFEPPAAPRPDPSRPRLEQLDLSELRLVAIVRDMQGRLAASVEDPQGIGFLVRPGTRIGTQGAVVKEISDDGVTIEEPDADGHEERPFRTGFLALRSRSTANSSLFPKPTTSNENDRGLASQSRNFVN